MGTGKFVCVCAYVSACVRKTCVCVPVDVGMTCDTISQPISSTSSVKCSHSNKCTLNK